MMVEAKTEIPSYDPPRGRPSKLVFIHRRGARMPMHFNSDTGAFSCPRGTDAHGPDRPFDGDNDRNVGGKYCALTENGAKMGRALGEKLRDDYGGMADVTRIDTDALLPNEYNVTLIKSRATASRGVVESAEAVLIGMFYNTTTDNNDHDNNESIPPTKAPSSMSPSQRTTTAPSPLVLPFVPYPPKELDDMLSFWSSTPSWTASAHEDITFTETAEEIMSIIGRGNMDTLAEAIGVLPFSRCYPNAEGSSGAYGTAGRARLNNGPVDDTLALTPATCVLAVYDLLAANYSNGIVIPPTVWQLWPSIKEAVGYLQTQLYGYRLERNIGNIGRKDGYSQQVGSLGALWADEVLSFFSPQKGSDEDGGHTVVRHYAAHEKTLVAVQGALGMLPPAVPSSPLGRHSSPHITNHTHRLLPPDYGAVIILEYYRGTDHVAARWGSPVQTPSNELPEIWLEYAPITCLGPGTVVGGNIGSDAGDAAPTTAPSHTRPYRPYPYSSGCPLSHLRGYINMTSQHRAPSPYGRTCYFTHSGLAAIGCLSLTERMVGGEGGKTRRESEKNAACLRFRKRCPFIPCGLRDGYISDPTGGYQCRKVRDSSDHGLFATVAVIAAVSVVSLLLGAVIGYYGVGALWPILLALCSGEGKQGRDHIGENTFLVSEE